MVFPQFLSKEQRVARREHRTSTTQEREREMQTTGDCSNRFVESARSGSPIERLVFTLWWLSQQATKASKLCASKRKVSPVANALIVHEANAVFAQHLHMCLLFLFHASDFLVSL